MVEAAGRRCALELAIVAVVKERIGLSMWLRSDVATSIDRGHECEISRSETGNGREGVSRGAVLDLCAGGGLKDNERRQPRGRQCR